jgi:hypothetical protein
VRHVDATWPSVTTFAPRDDVTATVASVRMNHHPSLSLSVVNMDDDPFGDPSPFGNPAPKQAAAAAPPTRRTIEDNEGTCAKTRALARVCGEADFHCVRGWRQSSYGR